MKELTLQRAAYSRNVHGFDARSLDVKREGHRRHAVNIIFTIYILIVFEGVLRKYLLPDLQRILIFMRDPVALYLYAHALSHGFIKRSTYLAIGTCLGLLAIFLVIIQQTAGEVPLMLAAYGFRQYFLLLPLPFIMSEVLRHEDMQRFLRFTLWCLIAMAPLMVAQVLSPTSSWINTGAASDASLQFRDLRYGDFVRAPGFFTAALSAAVFLNLAGAMVLAAFMMPLAMRPKRYLLLGGAFALVIALSVSGNRTAIVGMFLTVAGAAVSSVFLPFGSRVSTRALLVPLLLVGGGILISVFVFPDQFQAIQARWLKANDNSGMFSIVFRALGDFVSFTSVVDKVPLQGIGLGAGSNAFNILTAGGNFAIMPYVEADWSRHIVDLGSILGVFYIMFRIAFTAHLGTFALGILRRYADPRPLLIFSGVGVQILYGTMSGQSSVGGLGWFSAGLILAGARYARPFR